MHVRLFNIRSRRASQRNTVAPRPANHDPYAILSQLDSEFDTFGDGRTVHDVEAVAPGLIAMDGPEGPRVRRRAA